MKSFKQLPQTVTHRHRFHLPVPTNPFQLENFYRIAESNFSSFMISSQKQVNHPKESSHIFFIHKKSSPAFVNHQQTANLYRISGMQDARSFTRNSQFFFCEEIKLESLLLGHFTDVTKSFFPFVKKINSRGWIFYGKRFFL